MLPVYFTVWKLLVSLPHCVNVRVLGLAVAPPLGSLLPRLNENFAGLLELTSHPSPPVGLIQYFTSTPVSLFWVIVCCCWLPTRLSWRVSATAAIAGTASSTAIVKKRSLKLLLINIVRISTCLPSQFPYTSRSLCPFLSLSSLQLGSDFHNFRRLLPYCEDRLAGGGCWGVCQVANFVYAIWLFLREILAQRDMPRGICVTHIVPPVRMYRGRDAPARPRA